MDSATSRGEGGNRPAKRVDRCVTHQYGSYAEGVFKLLSRFVVPALGACNLIISGHNFEFKVLACGQWL